jgi:hypothetical protein
MAAIVPPANGHFGAGEAQLIPGTLRGYRCWNVIETAALSSMLGYLSRVKTTTPTHIDGVLTSVSTPNDWLTVEQEAVCKPRGQVGRSFHYHVVSQIAAQPPSVLLSGMTYEIIHTSDETVIRWSCVRDDCDVARAQSHSAPAPGCRCGIYGWYDLNDAMVEHSGEVLGVIEVSGRVILGTRGFRAERAKIVALAPNTSGLNPTYDHSSLTRRFQALGARYEVPMLDPGELYRRYPPDLETVKNLGVEPVPPPTRLFNPDGSQITRNLRVTWEF